MIMAATAVSSTTSSNLPVNSNHNNDDMEEVNGGGSSNIDFFDGVSNDVAADVASSHNSSSTNFQQQQTTKQQNSNHSNDTTACYCVNNSSNQDTIKNQHHNDAMNATTECVNRICLNDAGGHLENKSTATAKVFIELTDKIELDIPLEMWNHYNNMNHRRNNHRDNNINTNDETKVRVQEDDEILHDIDNGIDNDDIIVRDMILDYVWKHYSKQLKKAFHIKSYQERTTVEKQNHHLQLFDQCTKLQTQFLLKEEPKVVFGNLLDCLLETMDSEYGFIGEVKYDTPENGGDIYLQTHAITNIAWSAATRQFYDDNIEFGLKFTNLKSLFGTVMTTGQCLIANDPRNHPLAGGVPEGHPPLNHFLGIPFFLQGGKELNGMVGISNKPGGYTEEDVDFLQPLMVTCSNLIQAFRINRENEFFTNNLEDLVALRTKELECANLKVVETAKMQMEHFACMSHEIRTPLNCIVGLSSLLVSDSTLSSFQKDSIMMISKSGELLTAVVNDVLDYSKLETDNMTIDISYVNLQDTLDAVVHSIENKANEKNLKLRTYYDHTIPPSIHTDSRRLQQILYNLLGNAIKFSPSFDNNNKYNDSQNHFDSDNENLDNEGGNYNVIRKDCVELHLILVPVVDDTEEVVNNEQQQEEIIIVENNNVEQDEEIVLEGNLHEQSVDQSLENENVVICHNNSSEQVDNQATSTVATTSIETPLKASSDDVDQLPSFDTMSDDDTMDGSKRRDIERDCNHTAKRRNTSELPIRYEGSNDKDPEEQKGETSSVASSQCPFHHESSTMEDIPTTTENADNCGVLMVNDDDKEPVSSSMDRCPFVKMDKEPVTASIDRCPFVRMDQDPNNANHSANSRTKKDNSIEESKSHLEEELKGLQNHQKVSTIKDEQSKETVKKPKYRLRFVVKDYGRGIAKDDFGKIFEPFQQATTSINSRMQVHEGTGLGLAITSRLVKGLGGTISVNSEFGEWSEFAVEIPFLDEPIDYDNDPLYNDNNNKTKFNDVKIHVISPNKTSDRKNQSQIFGNLALTKLQQELNINEYNDCMELQDKLCMKDQNDGGNNHNPNQRHHDDMVHVFFMHEDSYEQNVYQNLSGDMKTALITYGSKYSLKESDRHFRSIYKTLPSVLLQTIITCIDAANDRCNNNHMDRSIGGTVYRNRINEAILSPTTRAKKKASLIDEVEETSVDYDKFSVLIAEDNLINQKVLLRMLNRVGVINVDIVDNGQKAVDQSAVKYYDVIFMDMEMPIMNGIEATQMIVQRYNNCSQQDNEQLSSNVSDGASDDNVTSSCRNEESYHWSNYMANSSTAQPSDTTPSFMKPLIFFVTAHATNDYESMALSAGGDGFISKPFNLDAIRNVFDRVGQR